MSDLVKRLRDNSDLLLKNMFITSASNAFEAADEIERKDAAIAELVVLLNDALDSFADYLEGGEADEWVILCRSAIAKHGIPKDGL